MALGNYNQNNSQYKDREVRSNYKYFNQDSTVDKSSIAISFWNGMLKIAISPLVQTPDGKYMSDKENAATVYLTHIKARLLAEEIKTFLSTPDTYNNLGIITGINEDLVSISNGREFGVNGTFLIIRRINKETGNIEGSIAYEFKVDAYQTIRNFDENSHSFDKFIHQDMELMTFITLLEEYYKAMTNAIAYSVSSVQTYDRTNLDTRIKAMCDKLGVETKSNSYTNSGNSKSFFANSETTNTKTFTTSSFEDIENMVG